LNLPGPIEPQLPNHAVPDSLNSLPPGKPLEGLAGAAPRRRTSAHHNDECEMMNDKSVSFIHAFIAHSFFHRF
jgi:hypothetical protein